jgi:hypothetical protein
MTAAADAGAPREPKCRWSAPGRRIVARQWRARRPARPRAHAPRRASDPVNIVPPDTKGPAARSPLRALPIWCVVSPEGFEPPTFWFVATGGSSRGGAARPARSGSVRDASRRFPLRPAGSRCDSHRDSHPGPDAPGAAPSGRRRPPPAAGRRRRRGPRRRRRHALARPRPVRFPAPAPAAGPGAPGGDLIVGRGRPTPGRPRRAAPRAARATRRRGRAPPPAPRRTASTPGRVAPPTAVPPPAPSRPLWRG